MPIAWFLNNISKLKDDSGQKSQIHQRKYLKSLIKDDEKNRIALENTLRNGIRRHTRGHNGKY